MINMIYIIWYDNYILVRPPLVEKSCGCIIIINDDNIMRIYI